MLLNSFARAEQRISATLFRRLANAVVSINGGPEFGGILDVDAAVGGVGAIGMQTTQPSVLVPAIQVPSDSEGKPVFVDGRQYFIGEAAPDGVDVRLHLQVKA